MSPAKKKAARGKAKAGGSQRLRVTLRGVTFDAPDPFAALEGLLSKYKISAEDPERWFKLAIALAMKHEESFQPRRVAGRGTLWSKPLLGALLYSVESRVSERVSARSACHALAGSEGWKALQLDGDTVYRRYQEAKKDEHLADRVKKLLRK